MWLQLKHLDSAISGIRHIEAIVRIDPKTARTSELSDANPGLPERRQLLPIARVDLNHGIAAQAYIDSALLIRSQSILGEMFRIGTLGKLEAAHWVEVQVEHLDPGSPAVQPENVFIVGGNLGWPLKLSVA